MNLRNTFKVILIFFSTVGFIGCVSLYLIFFFGDTSKERRKMIFKSVNSFIGIGEKFDGFIANTPDKILKRYYFYFSGKFKKFKYDSLNIEINLKNLKKLEQMRANKFNNSSLQQTASVDEFVNARVTLFNKDKNLNKKFKVRIRPKGDRNIHFLNLDEMSYKLDIRGSDNFIYGMEEMSIQKPIVRNYVWEILYHKILKDNGLISLKQIPIKLFRNGEYLGIFIIEEGFSKELIEKQMRKNGPIIGIDEGLSLKFPSLKYEYYSKNFWLENESDIFFKSKNDLDKLKENFNKKNFKLNQFFDLEKWAKFFAISDLLKMFHGTVPKSVKLYYNPTSGLFEPVAFDGHYLSGYDNFSFIDLIYDPNIKCGFACEHKNWLALFFNKKNKDFLNQYLFYLKKFSSIEYVSSINNIYDNEIKDINNFFYSEYQSADRAFFKGVLPYYFDLKVIAKRAGLLRNKLSFIDKYLENYFLDSKNNIDVSDINNNLNFKDSNILIPKGYWVAKDINLKDKKIFFENNSVLVLEGNNSLTGKKKVFEVSGNGMLVQKNGSLNLSNVRFENLKNVNLRGLNWTGSINVLNSILTIKDVKILDNLGEDSINIVGSNSTIENLTVFNSESDSIDIDFGKLSFNQILCEKSGNDCLDISGANVSGKKLVGNYIEDKLGSFGEGSKIEIDSIVGSNVFIGLASKDASNVKVKKLNLSKARINAASYNKKFFFDNSSLKIDNFLADDEELDQDKFLVSKGNQIFLKNETFNNYTDNNKIISQIYNK